MGETDPRVEIVARAIRHAAMLDADTLVEISPFDTGPADHEDAQGRKFIFAWRKKVPLAHAILAALDAARLVEPPCAPPKIDTSISLETRAALDELDGHTKKAAAVAPTILVGSSAWPVEPLQEYDATDAIDRAIRNWSTISDEPPADEEVAGLVERLRSLADLDARSGEPLGKCMREAAATIERQQAEVADLRAKLAKAVEALEPFAEEAEGWGFITDDSATPHIGYNVTVGDLRRARAALAPKEPAP